MITRYGMSEEFGMMALETVNNQYMGGDTSLACAAETAAAVDERVNSLLKQQYQKAKELLKEENKQCMNWQNICMRRRRSPGRSLWRF